MTFRSVFAPQVRALRRLVEVLLAAAIVALLIRFALQFHHPAKWDALWLVVRIRRWGDPLIVEAGSWLGLKWPSPWNSVEGFAPVFLALILWFVQGFASLWLGRLHRWMAAPPRPTGAEPRLQEMRDAWLARMVVTEALEGTQLAEPTPPPSPRMAAPKGPPAPPSPGASSTAPPSVKAPAGPAPARPADRTVPPPRVEPTLVPRLDPTVQEDRGHAIEDLVTRAGLPEALPSVPARRARPERIGRYEIVAELGRGAMGVVYKARDPQIGRTVAIKSVLAAHFSDESAERYKKRFLVEAQAAGKLSHAGIVAVHDVVEDEAGQPGLVMEFVEGTTLDRLAEAGSLSLEQAVDVVTQVAHALDYAHRQGVVHRDIKPANILVTAEGKAKVADFGIAKLAGVNLTTTGQLVGTPAFMSPEQFMGAAVDRRSDLFSLGSVLFWLATGEKPFAGETATAISYKVVHMPAPPARQLNPALPDALDRIIGRCLAKSPDERYPSGGEMAADLERLRSGLLAAEATVVQGPEE